MVLATLLAQSEAQKDTVKQVLQVYDEVRRPFSQNVLKLSYETGQLYCLESPQFADVTAEESARGKVPLSEMKALSEELGEILRWTWTTTIQGDRDVATQKLKTKICD